MPKSPVEITVSSREGLAEAEAAAGTAWSLAVVHSPDAARLAQHLALGTRLRLGREASAGVDVAIDDDKLSRLHATVTRAGGIVELRDHDSRNGTYVNGERVATRNLVPGDIVRVGDTLLELGQQPVGSANVEPGVVGTAPAFLAAVALAERVAPSDLPVLILGETGTGKDVLAQHLHRRSGRRGPLVAVNCAALADDLIESTLFGHKKGAFTGATSDSPGLFLEAQGGTLFLDEIGELGLVHQAKLLRALDAREIIPVGGARSVHTDARVIAATNLDLAARVADGRFRSDLYARLAGAVIQMPPLRARRGDVLALARHFLAQASPELARRMTGQAAEHLLQHPWPRNIRELLTAMRRVVLELGDRAEIRRADLEAVLEPPLAAAHAVPARAPGRDPRPGMPSREELVTQLAGLRGNISRLAALYGKDAKQIYRWLKRYQLDADSYR